MLSSAQKIGARFEALTALLSSRRRLWRDRPFAELVLSWEADHPAVGRWLRDLDDDAIDAIEAASPERGVPSVLQGWSDECAAVTSVDRLPRVEGQPAQEASSPVSPRKRGQIAAFCAAASVALPDDVPRVVDWCAGKGHLARQLHRTTGAPVIALERRADLCAAGAALAERYRVPVVFEAVDVLGGAAAAAVPSGAAVVGLHACGVLTDRLFELAASRHAVAAIAAPCCYHRLDGATEYVPRSRLGRRLDLHLSQGNLRLPTAHEVVARAPIRAARRREQVWRLGFDLLVRQASGVDSYVPQGRFEKAAFDKPFAEFCALAADRLERQLPPRWDAAAAERAGSERARHVRALGLVRGLFRRPMELWLVLDRALALCDRGRTAVVGTFCDPAVTPRNLMIVSVAE